MRLGEVLVHRGVISEIQLKKALDAQLIFGAHLGTCLIELGYIDEDNLGSLLSEILGVKYAHRGLLAEIPPNIIGMLTPAAVEKHKAVPFELSGKTLKVAMVDPKSLNSLDELSFISGYRVDAWVAPEVRIMQAIERYYDVPRRLRYITLAHRLDSEKPAQGRQAKNIAVQRKTAVATMGEESSGARAASPVSPVSSVQTAPAPARVEDGLGKAAEELCQAEDSAQVARVILNHMAHGMPRSILFSVRGEEASVWDTRGFVLTPTRSNRALFQITTEPVFELLYGESSFRGSIPPGGRFNGFFEILGIERPTEALILPVHLHDRLVAMFYGDGGLDGTIKGETEEYRRIISKLALAIELLLLKRKIRAT